MTTIIKKSNKKKFQAFTLIELLVVIAVVAIIATLAVIALQQARSRARDSKRIADVKQVQTALELFFNEQGRYPTVDEWNSGSLITSTSQILMQDIPVAPYPADGSCDSNQNNFYYEPSEDYSTYSLSFCLGNDVSDLSEGLKCLTPGGILDYDCSSGSSGGEGEISGNICYPDCQSGYICQTGSCVVDAFECGQSVSYNGYTYPTVAIGSQCWFKENLKTDKFKNGDSIPRITGSWGGTTISPWISYHNNSAYYPVYDFYPGVDSYGYVYSSHAVIDPRGLCPEGWRVATQSDFTTLLSSIGTYNAYNLRSCRQVSSPLGGSCATTEHPRWGSDTVYGTDDLGFSLLPGGHKYSTQWPYFGTGYYIWTSTPNSLGTSFYEISNTGGSTIGTAGTTIIDSIYGRYIRCVKKTDLSPKTIPTVTTSSVTNISSTKISSGGNVTADGGTPVFTKGLVWSQGNNPLIGDGASKFLNTTSTGSSFSLDVFYGLEPGKNYYIRAYAVNEVGIAYGNVVSFTTTNPCSGLSSVSYNGYTYPTVAIGSQCWFKENLKTDKFKNGDSIPRITGSWGGTTISPWISYHNNSAYYPVYDFYPGVDSYGYVYSSHAVIDPRGLCPEGWRVATQSDFTTLLSSIGTYNAYNLRSCRQVSSPLGGSCTTTEHPRWNSNSNYGTDDLGFSLLPGGNKYSTTWNYFLTGYYVWTSTLDGPGTSLYYFVNTGGNSLGSQMTNLTSVYGMYTRCIKSD